MSAYKFTLANRRGRIEIDFLCKLATNMVSQEVVERKTKVLVIDLCMRCKLILTRRRGYKIKRALEYNFKSDKKGSLCRRRVKRLYYWIAF